MLAALPGVRRVESVMGMPIVVDVRDEHVDDATLDGMYDWFRWVDATFSTYKEESEISRLNRGELTLEQAHPDLCEVLERCEQAREETNGYFDVRAASPEAIDPSGLVKGWSVDRAAAILDEAGVRNYAVNAGGDMRLRGRPVPELRWRVGIQHPYERHRLAAVVASSDLAIATSGAYARGDHVLDPHTRRPPGGVLSVTVVGRDLATADAYATAAFAMGGAAGPAWTARLRGYEAMSILADETVLTTAGFPLAAPDEGPAANGQGSPSQERTNPLQAPARMSA
jgi:thiamine biosynthesis lipoprotein